MILKLKQLLKKFPLFFSVFGILIVATSATIALANQNQLAIKADVVNVRVGPGLSYNIMTQVNAGEKINILDTRNQWYKVRLSSDRIGWVASWLVDNTEVSDANNKVSSVSATETSIHEKADSTSQVLGTLAKNSKVTIVYQENGWAQINYKDTVGWIQVADLAISVQDTDSTDTRETKAKAAVKTQNEKTIKTVVIQSSGGTIRSDASSDSEALVLLNEDTVLEYLGTSGDWYKVSTDTNVTGYVSKSVGKLTTAAVNVKSASATLKEATVLLDAGHGGYDTGAPSNFNTDEKTFTLETVNAVKDKLEAAGVKVVLTRNDDSFIDLKPRSALSNKIKADVFISIHYDSSDIANTASGTTTYYYTPQKDLSLATALNTQIKKLSIDNRGVNFANYSVLRLNKQPSVLLELGYINDDDDYNYIKSSTYQKDVANAILAGLKNYFK